MWCPGRRIPHLHVKFVSTNSGWRRWTFGATTFFLDNETYVEVGKISQEASKKMAAINGGTMVLMPQPISMSMIKASQARGRNPMNLTCREQMCKLASRY